MKQSDNRYIEPDMSDEEVLEVLAEVQLQQFYVKIRDQLQITQ